VGEAAADAGPGLNGQRGATGRELAASQMISRTPLERVDEEGEIPVGDGCLDAVTVLREYRRTRGIRWEAGWTTTQG
jgi:hypothetical protein